MPRRYEDEDDDRGRYEDEDRGRPQQTSGMAIFSLILGIASFLCMALAGLPAILLGFLALGAIKRGEGRVTGKGLALTGIILGFVTTLICTPLVSLGSYYGYLRIEESAANLTSQNNLKQIGLAMHNYDDTYNQFPPAVVCDKDGKPLYSWRVLLLPYVEGDNIYRQFHLDEPWDSPHNRRFLESMPKVYAPPRSTTPTQPGYTYYQVFDGPGAMFNSDEKQPLRDCLGTFANGQNMKQRGEGVRISGITDGTSNTFLVAEAGTAVPWTAPQDIPFAQGKPLPPLGGLFRYHFNVAMCDGFVRRMDKTTADATLRAAITRSGGEVVFLP